MKPEPTSRRASEHETIEATAAAWLAQRDDGLDAAAAAEFELWRRKDPRHEAAVARLETTWHTLQQLRDFRPAARMHPDRDLLAGAAPRRYVFRPAWGALAAAALIALGAVWWVRPEPGATPARSIHYVTTTGGYQRGVLPDGSVVELNANTELHVDYGAAERTVQMIRGEAHFSVAANPHKPFVVEARGLKVRALGTAFNVRLTQTEIEVLVTEGKVEVRQESQPVAPPLLAGERLVWSEKPADTKPVPEVGPVASEVMREALAWQRLRLVFTDTPLAEVIEQFNRHNQVQLQLADPVLATLPIGGSFRPENVEAFVRLLVSDGSIVIERPHAQLIVLHPAR